MENQSVEEKHKPVFDEQTLARLLEAAYILQEHNRELRELETGLKGKMTQLDAEVRAASKPSASKPAAPKEIPRQGHRQKDYSSILEQVVNTQQRIQVGHLDSESAMSLVLERLVEIGGAAGASIAILNGDRVLYRAVAGRTMLQAGTEILLEDALCALCVQTAEVFRCAEINPVILPNLEECRRSGIQSFITAPIFQKDKVAGAMELYYPEPHGFSEQDVHTCQLMAGLVSEVLARDAQAAAKTSFAIDRTESPKQMKPGRLVDIPAVKDTGFQSWSHPATSYLCHNCGHELLAKEQFCVECGTPRARAQEVREPIKAGSPWDALSAPIQPTSAGADRTSAIAQPRQMSIEALSDKSWVDDLKQPLPEFVPSAEIAGEELAVPSETPAVYEHAVTDLENVSEADEAVSPAESVSLAKLPRSADWSSALSAREFFEQIASAHKQAAIVRFWNERRGDVYLAIAVLLVACVIRWTIWSSPAAVNATAAPTAAATPHHKSQVADLSLFDRMLISLGLAEAPEPPAEKGNPATQVWVDLHTALYYCPGADLYGKTSAGKYTSQRDAQLDQFEPAYRKVCE